MARSVPTSSDWKNANSASPNSRCKIEGSLTLSTATFRSSSDPPIVIRLKELMFDELAFAFESSSFSFFAAAALEPKENLLRNDRMEGSNVPVVVLFVVVGLGASGVCKLSGATEGLVPADDMCTGENERAGVELDSNVPDMSSIGRDLASLLVPSGATAVRLDIDWLREERAENISSLA